MNTILLHPSDVLFFRDGRPMTGSLAGHGAAWPMPNVINAAFHAALHRSGFGEESHAHRRGGRGVYAGDAKRDRKFGSLVTAGPFPVEDGKTWFFPRPHDLQDATLEPGLLPTDSLDPVQSSVADPLEYAMANRLPPSKESGAKAWLSAAAYRRYLDSACPEPGSDHFKSDADFSDVEQTIGIAIDPATGTTGLGEASGKIYSAHYIRLRENWGFGVCAAAEDKGFNRPPYGGDLVRSLLNGGGNQIIVGGQQRVCSAVRLPDSPIPLPCGKLDGFVESDGKFLVKWILLSPAVWPAITASGVRQINGHPGGWLPNWIEPQTGAVLLRGVTKEERKRRRSLAAGGRGYRGEEGSMEISAKLVAAIVPKPLVVTGWSLPDEHADIEAERNGGAQSTHLAVPAGAVYYFETRTADEARKLAAALNWHGAEEKPTTIKNRRSALLGEKGFGLGVCGTWKFFRDVSGRSGK